MKAKTISEKLTGHQQAIQRLKAPNAEQVVKKLLNLVELGCSPATTLIMVLPLFCLV